MSNEQYMYFMARNTASSVIIKGMHHLWATISLRHSGNVSEITRSFKQMIELGLINTALITSSKITKTQSEFTTRLQNIIYFSRRSPEQIEFANITPPAETERIESKHYKFMPRHNLGYTEIWEDEVMSDDGRTHYLLVVNLKNGQVKRI